MLLWAMENQAPANIMLISGDRDFAYVLHQLGMKKYNILLAQPENASPFLIAAAKTVCLWTNIVASKVPNEQAQPSEKNQRYCEKCNVTCTSMIDFNSHLSSKKHKKKVKLYPLSCRLVCACLFSLLERAQSRVQFRRSFSLVSIS